MLAYSPSLHSTFMDWGIKTLLRGYRWISRFIHSGGLLVANPFWYFVLMYPVLFLCTSLFRRLSAFTPLVWCTSCCFPVIPSCIFCYLASFVIVLEKCQSCLYWIYALNHDRDPGYCLVWNQIFLTTENWNQDRSCSEIFMRTTTAAFIYIS